MKKIKLFAPVLGASLTCIAMATTVACAPGGGEEEDTKYVKVELSSKAEHIKMTISPEKPAVGEAFKIILTADGEYKIDSKSITLEIDKKKVETVDVTMSKEDQVATIAISKDTEGESFFVNATVKSNEPVDHWEYINEDGTLNAYSPIFLYDGQEEFDSEEQIFKKYQETIMNDHNILIDDLLNKCNDIVADAIEQLHEEGEVTTAAFSVNDISVTGDRISGCMNLQMVVDVDGETHNWIGKSTFKNIPYHFVYTEEDKMLRGLWDTLVSTEEIAKSSGWEITYEYELLSGTSDTCKWSPDTAPKEGTPDWSLFRQSLKYLNIDEIHYLSNIDVITQ